jgi:acetyl esterase/lipase
VRKLIRIVAILVLVLFAAGIQGVRAQTTDDQALQIARRLVTLFNQGDFNGAYALFNEDMTKAITIPQLEGLWKSFVQSKGGYHGETAHAVGSVQGFKSVVLTTQFKNDSQNVIITVNDKGQIAGLFFRPVEQAKVELSADEQEVTFKNGVDTFYGTLLIPKNAKGEVPAVLLLSGSGPTDRDGNNALLSGKTDSHKNFARVFADAGVASLRYDKYGTGKTGLGSYANKLASMTFDAYVDLALDAYQYLGSRPEIDPARLAILGHSEGGLIAMVAADRMKDATPPIALLLAAPLCKPYLTTIREQISEQYANAVKAGAFTQQQADDGMAELDRIIAEVIKDATAPEKVSPQFATIFIPDNLGFLQNANQYDPPKLAANLPSRIHVLVLCGKKDQQVPCDNVKLLVDGFKQGGNTGVQFAELTDVNHVFKEVEGVSNPATDYTDPAMPFSREARQIITEFVKATLLR